MTSVYQDLILDHYRNPRNFRKLESPTVSVSNPSCGDRIAMEILEEDGIIKDVAFSGEGCAISIASTSMITEYAKGKSKDELKKLDKEDIIEMLGIELTPNRLKCALLGWEALRKAIETRN